MNSYLTHEKYLKNIGKYIKITEFKDETGLLGAS